MVALTYLSALQHARCHMNKKTLNHPVEISIGDATVSIDIPESLFDGISNHAETFTSYSMHSFTAQTFAELLRGLLPQEHRPPTVKQESYANNIAEQLGIELPDEALTSVILCSAFIDEHLEAFEESKLLASVQQEVPPIGRVIYYLNKYLDKLSRSECSARAVANKDDLEVVGQSIGVRPSTVKKYATDFRHMKGMAERQGTWHVREIWLSEYNGGTPAGEIYTRYQEEVRDWYSNN